MIRFKEKKTGRVWYITNEEHIKHFRSNPRFVEIKEEKKKEAKTPTDGENAEK